MKAAIVTFHCSYNFGSALQAYALQRVIEKCGHESVIVDYRSRDFNQYKLIGLGKPKTILRYAHTYRKNLGRKRSFEDFWSKYFHLTTAKYTYAHEERLSGLASEYDCFVCGSDQIWNLDCTHGVVEPYFLSFAGGKRRVAYAPSLAHTSFRPENFDKGKVAGLLSAFDCLSVREEATLPLFQPLVDKRIDVVLDPTLLLDSADYSTMVEKCSVQGDEYIFVYLLRKCPELIESAKAIAEATGRRVVYVSDADLPIPGSKNLYGIGPEGFVSLIANASLVLTNSFHASVFSILFHKPFRVFATDESGSRMRGLLGELDLGSRCVAEVDASPVPEADWDDVQKRLDAMRRHSLDYLKKALS